MAKSKTLYQCQQCGGHSSKWQGQCPHCFEWNCLEEQVLQTSTSRFKSLNKKSNLILTRKIGDRVKVYTLGGDMGTITVTSISQRACKLAFEADSNVRIDREEVYTKKEKK